jgi:hypothetical protein
LEKLEQEESKCTQLMKKQIEVSSLLNEKVQLFQESQE